MLTKKKLTHDAEFRGKLALVLGKRIPLGTKIEYTALSEEISKRTKYSVNYNSSRLTMHIFVHQHKIQIRREALNSTRNWVVVATFKGERAIEKALKFIHETKVPDATHD